MSGLSVIVGDEDDEVVDTVLLEDLNANEVQ